MELVAVWRGSLERSGLAPGLSTYTGPSPLASASPDDWEPGDGTRIKPDAERDALNAKILHALRSGETYRAIRRDFGVTYERVSALAATHNLIRRPNQSLSPERVDAVGVLLRAGLTYSAIEARYGVSIQQARMVAAKLGIARVMGRPKVVA